MRFLWRALCWILEAAAWALALGAAAAAVGANGGRWVDRLDYLTHPVLVFLAAGVAAFILSWFSPSVGRGWTIRGLALVAIGASCLVVSPDFTRSRLPPAPAGAPYQIKLIEFNAEGEDSNPDVVARWIAAQDPDIAVVVEPTKEIEAAIQTNTGLITYNHDGSITATRHKPVRSRVNWDVREVPGLASSLNLPSIYGFDGQPFDLLAVHMLWPIPARNRRSVDLHYALLLDQEDRSRTILTGDFNSTQFSFRQRQADSGYGLERRDQVLPTWPAVIPQLKRLWFPLPFMPIDHIYAGPLWRTVKVERGPRLGSDHYPIIATLAWVGPVGGDPRLWPNAH